MARLAFGLGGAAIGSFFGAPNLGFTIGSLLGRFLFPDPPVITEGPRLGDLNVSGASYGIPIRLGYGTVRMSGNLIWAGAVRENEHREETSGGKGGGPSQVQVTYTYFASSAFAFSAGEAEDILRIWFDNRLVYDKRGQSTTRKAGLSFTFYKGDETQLPDPVIEAEEGAGQVPGHRGLCYIVLNDLELTDFGNRLPQVSAEIAYKSQGANSDRFSDDFTTGEGGLFDSQQVDDIGIDFKRRRIYILDTSGSPQGIRVYDMNTLNEIRQAEEADVLDAPFGIGFSSSGEMSVGKSSGYIYCTAGASNTRPLIKIDPNTLTEVGRFGFESTLGGPPTTFDAVNLTVELVGIVPVMTPGEPGRKHFLMCRGLFDQLYIADADDMTYLYDDESFATEIRGMTAAKPLVGTAVGWIMTQNGTGNTSLLIHKVEIDTAAAVFGGGTIGVDVNQVDTITSSAWSSDAAAASPAIGPIFDETDEGLIFVINGAGAGSDSYVFKWREDDGVVWTTYVSGVALPVQKQGFTQSRLNEGLFGYTDTTGNAVLIDTADGSIVEAAFDWGTLTPTVNPSGQQVYDGQTQSIIAVQGVGAPSAIGQLFLGRRSGLGESLATIVADLSERVGLDPLADLDTTELTDTVRGYGVTRQMPARQAIEPLQRAFFFDGVESDNTIVFKKRGRDPIRTIADDDLIPLNETFDVVQETRTQEVELPERVSVVYLDADRDYTEGAQAIKRVLNPTPTMRSQNETTVTLPIVFNADEASQIAEKTLFTVWNERTSYSWRAPWEHMDLDPADVILLTLDNQVAETTLRTRIAKAVVNLDLTVSFEGITEDKITVVSDATGDSGGGFPQQEVPGPAFTQLFLLDIPLLRDVDDTGRIASRLYLAMQGFEANWPGGTLFDSADGFGFGNTGVRCPLGVDHGIVINALPDTDLPFQTDTTTQLQVLMTFGELSSVTETQFLNSENAALVGNPITGNWELILFKDVVQNADTSYTISTIMRGRRGTEVNVGTHAAAETFILLDRDTINSYLLDLSTLAVTRFYKGVGSGSLPEDADIEGLASTMADLKPYAPAHLDAVVDVSDNIDLSWVRRTRVGGTLIGGTGTVPLAEDSEEYEVEILDAPGGSVVRTFTGLTSEAAEYTKAQITSDLGAGTGSTQLDVTDTNTFSRPAGSFVTDGFVAGMVIETSGFANGANNGQFTVLNVSATTLDIVGEGLIAETGSGDEQMDAIREEDVTFVVYQISAQVGRGFASEETITL